MHTKTAATRQSKKKDHVYILVLNNIIFYEFFIKKNVLSTNKIFVTTLYSI